ncbi:Hypothetical predicted protein, partial [Pelobates cultripes]
MEQLNSEELHSLLDNTMTRSVTQAIYSAMGTMSDTISHSITNAIRASNRNPDVTQPKACENKPIASSGRKATAKTHHVGAHASKTDFMDRLRPVSIEVVGPPRKRATRRAKKARTWKRAIALSDSSDLDSDSEESLNKPNDIGSTESEVSSTGHSPK